MGLKSSLSQRTQAPLPGNTGHESDVRSVSSVHLSAALTIHFHQIYLFLYGCPVLCRMKQSTSELSPPLVKMGKKGQYRISPPPWSLALFFKTFLVFFRPSNVFRGQGLGCPWQKLDSLGSFGMDLDVFFGLVSFNCSLMARVARFLFQIS